MLSTQSITKRRLATTLGFVLLSACSSTPGAKDIPADAEFSTRILTDNTKLFTLKIHPPGPDRDRGPGGTTRKGGGRGGAGGDCFPCEPGDRGGSPGGAMRTRELNLKAIAIAMIAENHFCREGFVVLEQFHQDRSSVMRGECRDSADANDRTRFTQ